VNVDVEARLLQWQCYRLNSAGTFSFMWFLLPPGVVGTANAPSEIMILEHSHDAPIVHSCRNKLCLTRMLCHILGTETLISQHAGVQFKPSF
jgi:hypothetical protein